MEPEGKPAGLHLTSPSDPGGSPQAHIGFEFLCVCPAPSKVPGGLFLTVSCPCSSELPHTGCVLADSDPLSPGSFRDLRDLSLSPAHGACPSGHVHPAGGPLPERDPGVCMSVLGISFHITGLGMFIELLVLILKSVRATFASIQSYHPSKLLRRRPAPPFPKDYIYLSCQVRLPSSPPTTHID